MHKKAGPPLTMSLSAGSADTIARAFTTAYLVTGSLSCAERIVLSAIEALEPQQPWSRALLIETLRLSTDIAWESVKDHERAGPAMQLPQELTTLMQLEPVPRNSFVARVLLGLSLAECVLVLELDAVVITTALIDATRFLSQWRLTAAEDHENAAWSYPNGMMPCGALRITSRLTTDVSTAYSQD